MYVQIRLIVKKYIYAYLQKQQEKKSFEILQKNVFHSEESFAKSNIAYLVW